jgi:NADH-quinone oxidoreductase subunit G
MLGALAGIAKSVLHIRGEKPPANCEHIFSNIDTNDTHLAIAEHLTAADKAGVILGTQAQMMPYLTELRVLANVIATASGAQFGYLTEGSNTTGAWMCGILPHTDSAETGMNVQEMMTQGIKNCVLLGIEPEMDMANPSQAISTLKNADFVVSLTPFVSDTMKDYAHVLLPVTPVSETSGTFINVEGSRQSFTGVTQPVGDSRPAWKVLRVLGNLLNLDDFEYVSSEQVLDAALARIGDVEMLNSVSSDVPIKLPVPINGLVRIGAVQTYHEDNVVRRATALQKTSDARDTQVRIHPDLAARLGLQDADKVLVSQEGDGVGINFCTDEGIPEDCVWVSTACIESADLGALFTPVQVEAD